MKFIVIIIYMHHKNIGSMDLNLLKVFYAYDNIIIKIIRLKMKFEHVQLSFGKRLSGIGIVDLKIVKSFTGIGHPTMIGA